MQMKSKRVLFIATVVKTHIMTFHIPYLKMFKEMGYETVVAARNDYENKCDCNIPYCDRFYDIPFQREPFNYENLKCYKQLKSIIDEGDFSIVHCHTPVGGVLGRLAARNARKKGARIIYTAHGFHFYKGAPIKNWLLFYPAEKLCAHFTDVLITINKEDYLLAQKKMKAKCVKYVPGVGVDLNKFGKSTVDKATKRRELGVPEDSLVILSVGELTPGKNHETAIRAVADIDAYYLIAGDGVLRQHLQSKIDELGVNNKVKLLGYRRDVADLCKAADIFVFPSFREGLPVAVMEAMASGLPCVVSKIRGNTDLLENTDGGFLCDPKDASEFAEKLKILASDAKMREEMGRNNLDGIQAFSIETVTDEMRKIYDEALADS